MPGIHAIQSAAERIAARIVADDKWEISYTLDLALEGLLALSAITGEKKWKAHVNSVVQRRGWKSDTRIPWRKEPFACLSWHLATSNNDELALHAFLEESRKEKTEIWRSDDGLILHPRGESRGGGYAVLIDSFAAYIPRMARAAALSGDIAFTDDAVEQLARHRDLLRNPQTGLWSQGRGWIEKDKPTLSPGAWSRGQGWIMKGLAEALDCFSGPGAGKIPHGIFHELADTLLPLQDPAGLWHALPHRPLHESPIETSGSALIAAALLRHGSDTHRAAAWKTIDALLENVDHDGIVHNACYGPGPLQTEEPWLVEKFPPGDSHGPGPALAALTAALEVHSQK